MTTEPTIICPAGHRPRTIHDRIIVSAGIGEAYLPGLASTRAHCAVHSPEAWQLMYTYYPEGCPPHQVSQYAFKIFALRRAVEAGFRYVLWMDSTFQPIASMEPLWDAIAKDGWYVAPQEDARLGEWCSDAALPCGRDEAMRIPLVYSGLVGLDMVDPTGSAIWLFWQAKFEACLFNGPHRNIPGMQGPFLPWGDKFAGHVSHDPRVKGHRHDEAALSAILWSMNLKPDAKGFTTYHSPDGFIDHHVPLNYLMAVQGSRKPACKECGLTPICHTGHAQLHPFEGVDANL